MNRQRFVVIDLETTGNAPKKGDKIIQIAAVVIEDGQIVDRYMSFVNPMQTIPLFIEQLTGISNEMVKDAPTFDEIAEVLVNLLDDSFFVAHNVYFDLSFLQEELKNSGYQFSGPVLDTVELARIAFPTEKSYKLADLSDELNMQHDNPHRADSDAEATAHLLIRIFEKIKALPIVTLQQLSKLSRSFIGDLEELLEELIANKLVCIDQQKNKNIEVIRTLAIKRISKDKEKVLYKEDLPSPNQVFELFENKLGNINKVFPTYKVRLEQIKMMKEVFKAFETHQHAVIEAQTGSGKTIAYLVPAILYSKKNQRPVIVSTYTTNLQSQILEQDIPLLKGLVPFSFSATILKGQRYYLCLQKFEQSLKETDNNYDFVLTKAQLLLWLTETETGDIDELNIPSGGRVLWNHLHVDRSSISKNPFSTYCFYQRAKKKATTADIIITNHALLLKDMNSTQDLTILPNYDEVIIDEAHHFHQVATEHLGIRLSYLDLHGSISHLGLVSSNGLVQKVNNLKNKLGIKLESERLYTLLMELQEESHHLFSSIHHYVLKRKGQSSLNRTSYKYNTVTENSAAWKSIVETANRTKFLIHDILIVMERSIAELLKRDKINLSIKDKITLENFKDMNTKFNDFKNKIDYLFFEDDQSTVTWIEIDTKGAKNAVSLYAQPIQVSEYLADDFFANKKSTVLTSATLTVRNSFKYMIDAVGLSDFYPLELQLPSPFDYKNQAKLFVPSDMPNINRVTMDDYSEAIAVNISSVAHVTDGKMLVLFTAYDMLKKTYQILKEDETLEEFVIMGQGTGAGSRTRLTKNFKQFEKAILLGTASFWEGVDFPGENLTALMIVRLPFASPEEPIVAAKSTYLEERGKSSFNEYSLPEAVLRFKQGIGRLIRNEDDRGVVFVLDNRIISTKYGQAFLSSIPDLNVEKKPMHLLLHSLENWLKGKNG